MTSIFYYDQKGDKKKRLDNFCLVQKNWDVGGIRKMKSVEGGGWTEEKKESMHSL